jgi:hypothetical protein
MLDWKRGTMKWKGCVRHTQRNVEIGSDAFALKAVETTAILDRVGQSNGFRMNASLQPAVRRSSVQIAAAASFCTAVF